MIIMLITKKKRGVVANFLYTYIGPTYVDFVVAIIRHRYYFQINMVMVEINSNKILAKPLKSQKDPKITRAYRVIILRLKRGGIIPKKHVLDNEVSEPIKEVMRK